MDILSKVFSRSEKKPDFLSKSEEAAQIVSKGIAEGNFSDLNSKVIKITEGTEEKEKYVFSTEHYGRSIISSVLLVLGCLVFGYSLILSIAIIVYSSEFEIWGISGLVLSLAILALNIFVISKEVHNIKLLQRYQKYEPLLKRKTIHIIEDIAEYSSVQENIVISDLTNAIKRKYIPQGHFGTENMIFIVSNEAYEKYLEKQAVYDRYYRKQIEERARMKERSEEIALIMESGQKYIKKIHESNDLIKEKDISKKLEQMEKMVSAIFYEVDINPDHASELGLFLDYYLPTTEILLEAYVNLNEKEVKRKGLDATKKEIETSLDTINLTFEKILDGFYEMQEIEVLSNISALELVMKQEENI